MTQLCSECERRPARYRLNVNGGIFQARRNHDLCLQCFRSKVEASRQEQKFTEEVAWLVRCPRM
jgi:hypothetical protein